MTGSPVFAGDIRPQHGTNNEVGGSVNLGSFKLTGSVYQLDLTDEIGYDGAQFSNVNFDWTRRRGAQTEISWKPYDAWLFKLSYSYVDAQFTNGAYKGKQLPLVPHDIASLLSTWDSGAWGRYSAQIRFVGERAYDGDLANKAGMASGYTTLDLQAAWNIRAWRVTFKVLNALDQHYAPDTVFSANQNKFGYYPADGRAMFVSLGYQF